MMLQASGVWGFANGSDVDFRIRSHQTIARGQACSMMLNATLGCRARNPIALARLRPGSRDDPIKSEILPRSYWKEIKFDHWRKFVPGYYTLPRSMNASNGMPIRFLSSTRVICFINTLAKWDECAVTPFCFNVYVYMGLPSITT